LLVIAIAATIALAASVFGAAINDSIVRSTTCIFVNRSC
jgi:hypothetical protein